MNNYREALEEILNICHCAYKSDNNFSDCKYCDVRVGCVHRIAGQALLKPQLIHSDERKDPMDIAKEEYEYNCENAEWQADAYVDAIWGR